MRDMPPSERVQAQQEAEVRHGNNSYWVKNVVRLSI
jgi:hypothetical protein